MTRATGVPKTEEEKFGSRIGYQHSTELLPGMGGVKKKNSSTWQGIYVAEPCSSGICWKKLTVDLGESH